MQLAQGSVLEQVRDVQSRLASLLRHEHAPLSLAQRCSGVQAPAPLFSALLNYRHSQATPRQTAHAAWQGIEILIGEERTNYPIVLDVDDLGEGFVADGANPAAGGAGTAVRDDAHGAGEPDHRPGKRAGHRHAAGSASCRSAERRQVLYDWNATQADYPRDSCVHELFEAQVQQHAGCGGAGVRGSGS